MSETRPDTTPRPPVDADPAAQLRRAAATLTRPREAIEAAFVDVGARLMESAGVLNRITATFEALPADLESVELQEATARLAAIGVRAREISESFVAEQEAISRLVDVVAAAGHPIDDLRKAVRMMGIVAINARVVAAGVVDGRNGFDVFTTDIASLSEDATRTIHDFSETYQQLSTDVHLAAEQRASFERTQHSALADVAAQLDRSLAAMSQQRHASLEGSAETSRVTRDIATRVSAAVMAMQVGDATRQRLEHIEAGLMLTADLVEGQPAGDLLLTAAEAGPAAGVVASLEAAQLAATTESFAGEVGDAERALCDLAAAAHTITARSVEIYGDADGRHGQSALGALGDGIRHAADVLRQCEIERRKLDHLATAVAATVDVLLGHVEAVQAIEANMRLVSLNAAIKCAQLGPKGRALNVIAQQLRELTGGTVAAAEAAMSSLDKAAALAKSFGAASTGAAAGQVGRLEQEAQAAIGLLETVDRRLGEALLLLGSEGPAVVRLLEQAAAALSGHAEIAETLADARFEVVAAAADHLAAPDGSAAARVLAQLSRHYTMDAERQVHRDMFGTLHRPVPTSAPPSAEPAATEPETDDIFF